MSTPKKSKPSQAAAQKSGDAENLVKDLLNALKREWKNTKAEIKHAHEDKQKLGVRIAEQKTDIGTLRQELEKWYATIQTKKQEIAQLKHEMDFLKDQFKQLHQKNASVEIPYDKEIQERNSIIQQLQKEIDLKTKSNMQYNQKFEKFQATCNEKLKRQSIELEKRAALIQEEKANNKMLEESIAELKQQFAESKENMCKEYQDEISLTNANIASLHEELRAKEDLLQKIREENQELVKSNDKLIAEQNYRVRQIERACAQPLTLVEPQIPQYHNKSPSVFSNTSLNEAPKSEIRTRSVIQRRKQTASKSVPPKANSRQNIPSGKISVFGKVPRSATEFTKANSQVNGNSSKIAYQHSGNEFSSDEDGNYDKDAINNFLNGNNISSSNERKRTNPYEFNELTDSEESVKRTRQDSLI